MQFIHYPPRSMPLQGRLKEQLAATTALAAIETADAHNKHRPPMKAR